MNGETLGRWSLERVRFLLDHLEGFVESNSGEADLVARAKAFRPQTDLNAIENLTLCAPQDPALPGLVLERLSAFFDSGLLARHGSAGGWYVTDVFGRGVTFHLELNDQIAAPRLVPEITPLQVHRIEAAELLAKLGLSVLLPSPDAKAYLIKPTPTLALILVSNLGAPFAVDHVARIHALVNKSFLY